MIWLYAVLSGGVCWLAFQLYDRRNKPSEREAKLRSFFGIPLGKLPLSAQKGALYFSKYNAARDKLPKDRAVAVELVDYSSYEMNAREIVLSALCAGAAFGFIGFVFYKLASVALLFALLGLLFPKVRKKQLAKKRLQLLSLQFKQALNALSSSLVAGKSVENAFRNAAVDLRMLYPSSECHIIRELEIINRRIENGEQIEAALADFALRANLEDVTNFAAVFSTCKRTGGNLVQVIRRTSLILSEKLDIQQEITVMIAQKKLESKILTAAPVLIVALLSISSPEYMSPLYSGRGYLITTIALLALLGCYGAAQKLMNLKV